ncbi:MAG: hypothetical protein JXR76_17515 [Deltaproteobacteria bacterium]|nr:hypothetical protein [Deltaproteobacteria bacterium]
MSNTTQVFGALIQGYVSACRNLNIVAGQKVDSIIRDLQVNKWYSLNDFVALQEIVKDTYNDSPAIFENVGIEMMKNWYDHGPGKQLVKTGVEFLTFQTSSEGYYSVIKGDADSIGEFKLTKLDETKGVAEIESSTPFNRNMERGVIYGGMKAPGDLSFLTVTNNEDENRFIIKFF